MNSIYKYLENNLTFTGYSRSAERTGFFIKELNYVLDAGEDLKENKPKMVFITHSHLDHCFYITKYIIENQNDIKIYVPKESYDYFQNYIFKSLEIMKEKVNNFELKGVKEKDIIKDEEYEIEIISCIHSVPTIGYLFQKKKERIFCYLGDTSIEIFEKKKEIFNYPLIICECTFLDEEHEKNSIDNEHIHFKQLLKYILKYPKIQFLLIHFSLRYKIQYIQDFFDKEIEKYNIKNIFIFI